MSDDRRARTGLDLELIRKTFGVSFWGFAAFAVISGLLCYFVIGEESFFVALDEDFDALVETMVRMVAAIGVAGFIYVMLPRDLLTRLLGTESGFRGLVVGTFAGIITPGGPASAFPLLVVLGGAGADRGALVAYIASWSMLGLQRIIVWDVPFMGADFSILRFVVSLPLPIIAGLIARKVPLHFKARTEKATEAHR